MSAIIGGLKSGPSAADIPRMNQVSEMLETEDLEWVARGALFRGVEVHAVARELAAARFDEYSLGAQLPVAGSAGGPLYVVISGELGVYLDEGRGLEIARVVAGGCAGEQSIIEAPAEPPWVYALQPTRLFAWPAGRVLESMLVEPHIAVNLISIVAERARRVRALHASGLAELEVSEFTSLTDVVTGLYNRRWMTEMYGRELERCARSHHGAVLIAISVDGFASFAGTLGHPGIEHLLQGAAQAIRHSFRPHDLCARYGGDEFMVLLPGASREHALRAAQRFAAHVRGHAVHAGRGMDVNYTVSIGLADWRSGEELDELFAAAEAALGAARSAGSDRIALRN